MAHSRTEHTLYAMGTLHVGSAVSLHLFKGGPVPRQSLPCSFSMIASAISEVPTAVGSFRSGFRS